MLVVLIVSLVAPQRVRAEAVALDQRLQVLAPLVGARWLGHFRNDPEAPDPIFSWDVILDGHGVRATFWIDEQGRRYNQLHTRENGEWRPARSTLFEGEQ